MEEEPTSYDDMLTNMVADTLCDAPDDHHCKFVFVVDCDQIPEARSSLGCHRTSTTLQDDLHDLHTIPTKNLAWTTMRFASRQITSVTSCARVRERTRAERVYGREERFFGSSHCPTDSRAWAKGDDESKNSASVTSPSQEAGICCEQESCILRAGQCLEGHCSRTARR